MHRCSGMNALNHSFSRHSAAAAINVRGRRQLSAGPHLHLADGLGGVLLLAPTPQAQPAQDRPQRRKAIACRHVVVMKN